MVDYRTRSASASGCACPAHARPQPAPLSRLGPASIPLPKTKRWKPACAVAHAVEVFDLDEPLRWRSPV
eukprot:284359-Alexandrium_andersonii.AAC.1